MAAAQANDTVSRRRFLRLSGASAGALATSGGALLAACERPDMLLDPSLAKGGSGKGGPKNQPTQRNPLNLPPVVSPAGLELRAAPAQVDLGGNDLATVWAYNDSFPGPTIQTRAGSSAALTLRNGLPDESITHWHGMIVDHANDGHPEFVVPPGGAYSYGFPIVQRATMNWYHPHPHEKTGEQVAMGLAGAFIIRDNVEDALNLPAGAREIPLIVRDADFDRANAIQYKPRSGGYLGKIPLVNGTRDPYLGVDTALYRVRILNGSNARIYRFALSDGRPFHLIGNDGGLLSAPAACAEILLSPAERVDALIDFRDLGLDGTVMLRDVDSGWDLLEFVATNKVNDNATIPGSLSTIAALSPPVSPSREFSFDGMSRINGKVYDMSAIEFTVPFATTERWRFTTNGNAPHPVHIHGAYFQVLERSGGRGALYPWEAGWKDTVLLEDGESVDVAIRFDAACNGGQTYLMHCHKLEHEDMGMMLNFRVSGGS
jgi:FtsP/CotA-like multicopper oxidase with cupredoxin domain